MRSLFAVLLISACAHDEGAWWRPGATTQAQRQALYECERDNRWVGTSGAFINGTGSVSSRRNFDEEGFDRCMEANGWTHYASVEAARAATQRGPYLPPAVEAQGPSGAYAPDAGWRPHKLE